MTVTEHVDGEGFRATVSVEGIIVEDETDPTRRCTIPDTEWTNLAIIPADG